MPFYLSTIFIGRQVVLLKSDEKARPSGSSENFAVTCPSLGSHANVQPTMVPMPMSSQCRDQRCRQKGGNLGKRILFVATGLIGSCINQFCDVNPKSMLKKILCCIFLGCQSAVALRHRLVKNLFWNLCKTGSREAA